jgi:hypothetical protein
VVVEIENVALFSSPKAQACGVGNGVGSWISVFKGLTKLGEIV